MLIYDGVGTGVVGTGVVGCVKNFSISGSKSSLFSTYVTYGAAPRSLITSVSLLFLTACSS